MKVHLLDGTYELFRHHYGAAAARRGQPTEDAASDDEAEHYAATRGVLWSVLNLLEEGVTHLGVATDHVIESFRNDMWPGYKSSAGMPEELLAQFPVLEEGLTALGVHLWPMVELEADDALAAAATKAAADPEVEQVVIMTPDKDLAQCVQGERVVQLDRRSNVVFDEDGVFEKFGVVPESIPDWLALVGDSADGFPGLAGWGKRSASVVLARYVHLEEIPTDPVAWDVVVRGSRRLVDTLVEDLKLVLLFRDLATLRKSAPVLEDIAQLEWRGPTAELDKVAKHVRAWRLVERAEALAAERGA